MPARHCAGDAAAEQGSGESGNHQEQPERRRRGSERDAALPHEVRRHPRRQAAHAERVDDLRGGVDDIASAAHERAERGRQSERRGRAVRRVLGAALGFREEEQQECESRPRRAGHEEGGAPAVGCADHAAHDVAQGGADRDRRVEDAEHARPPFSRVAIGEERRSHHRIARLSDADHRAGEKEPAVRRCQTRGDRRDAPHEHAPRDQAQAFADVAEPAGRPAGQRIRDDEQRLEQTALRIRDRQIGQDEGQRGRGDVAVDIVERVERRERAENDAGRARPTATGHRSHGRTAAPPVGRARPARAARSRARVARRAGAGGDHGRRRTRRRPAPVG